MREGDHRIMDGGGGGGKELSIWEKEGDIVWSYNKQGYCGIKNYGVHLVKIWDELSNCPVVSTQRPKQLQAD